MADVADGVDRAVARFGDLGLGHGGFGLCVHVGEMPDPGPHSAMCLAAAAMSPRRSAITARTQCAAEAYPSAPRAPAVARAAWPTAAALARRPLARWMRARR